MPPEDEARPRRRPTLLAAVVVVALTMATGFVALATPALADTGTITVEPVVAANGDDLSTIVINGSGLPVAASSQIGEESDETGVVQVSDDGAGESSCVFTCGWTAGGGAPGNDDTCDVTIGASTPTQMILGVGDEGAACTSALDDYVIAGDNITVTLFNPDGSSYGTVSTGAISPGTAPSVTSVNQPYGPEAGGTLANPGTGTVTVDTSSTTAAPEAIWFGATGITTNLFGVATTNFTATGNPGEYNVVPPAFYYGGQAQNDGVNVLTVDPANGMSTVDCTLEVSGCADEFFYLDNDSTTFTSPSLNGFELSQQLASFSDAGNACGQTAYNNASPGGSVTANFSGGPIEVSANYGTSDSNAGLPEALVGGATVTVRSPISVTISANLVLGGCLEVPFPDLALPNGLGGLYFVVGGTLTGSVNLTVTIDQGTYTINGGYIPGSQPGDLGGATVTTNCQDSNGNPTTDCLSTQLTASLTGTVVMSPLWLSFGPSAVNVGAGLIGAATGTITYPPSNGSSTDYDVCVGGLATAAVSVGSFQASYSAPWAGPLNIIGDGSICPIGNAAGSNPLPVVSSVSPNSGGVGTSVDIKGSGFTGATQVLFGSVAATSMTVNGDGDITATAPAGTGAVDVTVDTGNGDSATSSADTFTYSAAAPAVSGVSPAFGPTTGGTTVTVTGTGFTGATKVSFGSVAASSFTVVSDTQLTAVAPAQGDSQHGILVTGPGGTSTAVKADLFSYRPSVSGISPAAGPAGGGTTVTVTGAGFRGTSKVLFGSVPATSFTVVSDTQLTAVAPAQGAGQHGVLVGGPGGLSTAVKAGLYTYRPAVSSLSPASGPATGGTTVTVTGAGFTGATKVLFGSVPATSFTVLSDTQLTAVTPAQGAGQHGVVIGGPTGLSSPVAADIFTARPIVTGISPATGPASGGTTVTVTGVGFTGATKVLFGSVPATSFTVISDAKLTAVAPAQAAGQHGILVGGPGGLSTAVKADVFTYHGSSA